MKILIIIAVIIGGIYHYQAGNSFDLPIVLADAEGKRIESFEIDELYDEKTSLNDLAEEGSYTIVELYANDCGYCSRLEEKFPDFLKQRKDMVIKRVRVFSGRINFTTNNEMETWQRRQDDIRETYNYKGTPHIEIYDENGDVIARDDRRKKPGYKMLKHWLGMNT